MKPYDGQKLAFGEKQPFNWLQKANRIVKPKFQHLHEITKHIE